MAVALNPVAEKVRALLEPHIERQGFELVSVEYRKGAHSALLRLLIDRPDGRITLGEIEQLSPVIGDLLDVYDPIDGRYLLEVASPGINRPLRKRGHFEAYRGKRVKIRAVRQLGGRRSFVGLLATVADTGVEVDDEGSAQRVAIDFDDIEEANYEHDFQMEFGGMARAQRARARGRLR
ncbi:MAG: ribosome maturation factor RimP [Candidatus Binataceae bacterium]